MRTRIALVAIVSIALITVTLLGQLVSVQAARAATATTTVHRPAAPTAGGRHDQLTSDVTSAPKAGTPTITEPVLRLGVDLLAGRVAGTKEAIPVVPPAPPVPPGPVDTVTPAQRAAWERVAVCEEGGNWQSDGPRFSGGLGITRANWVNYGGLQYAPEGAEATPDEQIMVAERIQSSAPDQNGCRGW